MYVFVVALYAGVGTLGYWAYGPFVKTVVLSSLPQTWLTAFAKAVYCIGLLLTYPVLLSVVPMSAEPIIFEKLGAWRAIRDGWTKRKSTGKYARVPTMEEQGQGLDAGGLSTRPISRSPSRSRSPTARDRELPLIVDQVHGYPQSPSAQLTGSEFFSADERDAISRLFRTLLVLLTALVAIFAAGPNFANFVALVGTTMSCPLMLFFPAVMHLKMFWDDKKLHWCWKALDVFLAALGAFLVVFSTWITVQTF